MNRLTDVVLGQKYLSDSSAITDTLGQKAINADGEITKADIANILKTIMKR